MANSLQDQLLQAGLVDAKKAKQISKQQRKKKKQQNKGQLQEDDSKLAAQQALEEKSARDRAINLERQQEADQRAIMAQVRQLIELNKVTERKGDSAYQFADGKKIKKLYLRPDLTKQLVGGKLAIARFGDGYELIPSPVAEKIRQRDEESIVLLNENSATEEEDDYYADYKIPDDLMW